MGFEELQRVANATKGNITCGARWATQRGRPEVCGNWAEWWLGDSPLCSHHAGRAFASLDRYMERTIQERLTNALARRTNDELLQDAEDERREAMRVVRYSPDATVYYAERGEFIKIGSTTNVTKRLQELARRSVKCPRGMTMGPVTLLATHSGGMNAERILHDRFAIERDLGEWFRKSPRLLAHIDRIVVRRAAS